MHQREAVLFPLLLVLAVSTSAANGSFLNADSITDLIKSTFRTISDYVEDKNGCKYKCPDGEKPIPNTSHKQSSNGCGSFGLQLYGNEVLPSLERCCDEHDVCYDTCNKDKESCDDHFRKCLQKICKEIKKHVSENIYKTCKSSAEVLYAGVLALGCKPYRDSQKKACVCPAGRKDL